MFNWKYMLGLCWILKFANAIALPSAQLPRCNCIRVKECEPFARILLNHRPHESETIYKIVQNASCGFDGLDPLACCPNHPHDANQPPYTRTNSHGITSRSSDAWVWRDMPSARHHEETAHAISPRFSRTHQNRFLETDIFDFKDVKTHRNFPHSFYEEIDETAHFKDHSNHHHNYFTPPDFSHAPHNHFSPHSPYPLDPHVTEIDAHEDHGINNYPHFGFGHSNNGGVLYPDDKRLQRPVKLPEATTSMKPHTKPAQTAQPKVNPADCGMAAVDGSTGERQYPWIARIAYLNKTNDRISYRCSGSVISKYFILTAAHCVVNLINDLQISHVRIGGVLPAKNCAANCTNPRIYQIANVNVHPNYDQPKYANDIALLKFMPTNNEEEPSHTAICLPPNLAVSVMEKLIGSTGIALGWSADGEGNETNNPKVKYISLPIVNTTECAITYAKYSENFDDPIVITPSQLCAQGRYMNDVCRGDSGGPFMDDGTTGLINSSGRHSLLGIVAFGPTKCGDSNIPGVYTRVNSYLEWIIESIG